MGVGGVIAAAAAAQSEDLSSFDYAFPDIDVENDIGRRSLLHPGMPSPHPTPGQMPSYGATSSAGPSSLRASPEMYRRDSGLNRVPEEVDPDEEALEEADEEEWDLEEHGYYSGSYKRTVALYALVPITSLLAFVFLALLPTWIWPVHQRDSSTYPRYFQSPLPELLVSAALWCLSHFLRVPLYTLFSALFTSPISAVLLSRTAHAFLTQFLRISALALLRVRHEMVYPLPTWHDTAFRTIWWLALGWALAEAAVGIAQGYEQLALYRNVMVPEERVHELLTTWKDSEQGSGSISRQDCVPLSPHNGTGVVEVVNGNGRSGGRPLQPRRLDDAIRLAVDQDVEQLINLKEREELEEVYGLPVIYIPVFVSCLQRIDTFILSLGITLILSGAYLRSPVSFPTSTIPPPIYSNGPLFIAFPLVTLVHLALSLLYSPPVLPRIGVHTTAYCARKVLVVNRKDLRIAGLCPDSVPLHQRSVPPHDSLKDANH
ncbi:hypothetical protein A0H81_05511 [Grifola frondosa]|uniref:Uncharacterized protein n=1 Tax=Grifola frondosa TaxID=5627 RepID=A0A1C7MC03_GRIFR|nr:hypothetical protein A0H81_05511 [Grifola frondosa]